MKTQITKLSLIAGISILAIPVFQGIWIGNTYDLYKSEFVKLFKDAFAESAYKEGVARMDDPARKGRWKNKILEGYTMDNTMYDNIIAIHNYLYQEDYPFSLSQMDTILNRSIEEKVGKVQYTLLLLDSTGVCIDKISHSGSSEKSSFYTEKIQLRSIQPEYVEVFVASPYTIIFGKMLFLLLGSILLVVLIVTCVVFQIQIIMQQKRIAEVRQDFTNAIIHNIKDPISSILTANKILESGKIEGEPSSKEICYSTIRNEGNLIRSLADRVLTIARLDEPNVKLSKEKINLLDLIESVRGRDWDPKEKSLEFHVDVDSNFTLYADQGYLHGAFCNLVDNAIKYSKEKIVIRVSATKKQNEILISFKDEGIGISKKDQKLIFKKFERATAVRENSNVKGFGIGLNHVHRVISAHEGSIHVNSQLGIFSDFIIKLPL